MRTVTIVTLILISSLGLVTLLFTTRNVEPESGSRASEETTSAEKEDAERKRRSEPATATITFRRPVSVEEMLRVVGEENRKNITTVESSFEVGGEPVWESQPIPRKLRGAAEIERHLARNRLGALSDMSAVPEGPEGDPELRAEARKSERAAKDPATREVRISKVTLEGDSLELELLPDEPDENIRKVSVMTQSEMFEMIEKMQKEAERRGEAPLEFN